MLYAVGVMHVGGFYLKVGHRTLGRRLSHLDRVGGWLWFRAATQSFRLPAVQI